MHDPMTFERRLTDALEQYAASAPIDIDSAALVGGLAAGRPRGGGILGFPWTTRRLRLALLAGLLALAAGAALLAAGMSPSDDPLPGTHTERLMVWFPSDTTSGVVYMYDGAGELQWTRRFESRGGGCPTLLPGSGLVTGGFGVRHVFGDDGQKVAELDTSYSGGERWAPDRRAIALVDMERGPITIVKLGADSTTYGADGSLAGALEASLSNGGERVVLAVRSGTGVALHLLDGADTVITGDALLDTDLVALSVAPNGSRVAAVYQNRAGETEVKILALPDGALEAAGPTLEPGFEPGTIYPISWSPDGSTFALRTGSGMQLYDATTRAWRPTNLYYHPFVSTSRWREGAGAPLGLVMPGDGHMGVYREGQSSRQFLLQNGGAVSPDTSRVAMLEILPSTQPGANRTVRIRAIDPWGDDPLGLIATLPSDHPPILADGEPQPCIDWQPGGRP